MTDIMEIDACDPILLAMIEVNAKKQVTLFWILTANVDITYCFLLFQISKQTQVLFMHENTSQFENVSRSFWSYKIKYCFDIWCNLRNCIINYMFWIHFQKIENKSCNQETSSGCNCATVVRIWNFLWFNLGDWVWNPKQSDVLLWIYFYCRKYNWISSINFHDICHKVIFNALKTSG